MALPAPMSKSDLFWTCIVTFIHKWGLTGTRPVEWWGIECTVHRWSHMQNTLMTLTQILTYIPTEMLSFLTYLILPCTMPGSSNCLIREWPALLHDVIHNCLVSSSSSSFQTQKYRNSLPVMFLPISFPHIPCPCFLIGFGLYE